MSRVFRESASLGRPKLLQERESHLADSHVPPQGVDENVTLLLDDLSIPLLPLPLREARAREPVMDVHHWSTHATRATDAIPSKNTMKTSMLTSYVGRVPPWKGKGLCGLAANTPSCSPKAGTKGLSPLDNDLTHSERGHCISALRVYLPPFSPVGFIPLAPYNALV